MEHRNTPPPHQGPLRKGSWKLLWDWSALEGGHHLWTFVNAERICLDSPMQGHGMPLGWEEREGYSSPGLLQQLSPLLLVWGRQTQSQQPALTSRVGTEPEEAVAFPRRLQGQRKSPT